MLCMGRALKADPSLAHVGAMGLRILAPKAWCCLHFQAALLPLSPQPLLLPT